MQFQNTICALSSLTEMEMNSPLIGGILLVACDVSLVLPPDAMLNNKIAKLTINTDTATIKYFSNLVRVRHTVILCMDEMEIYKTGKNGDAFRMKVSVEIGWIYLSCVIAYVHRWYRGRFIQRPRSNTACVLVGKVCLFIPCHLREYRDKRKKEKKIFHRKFGSGYTVHGNALSLSHLNRHSVH